MSEVFLVHTYHPEAGEDIKVFPNKALAQVYSWNWYMQHAFDPIDCQDDWESLMLDSQIFCTTESGEKVRAVWITYHRVSESIEPQITFIINPKKND